MKKIRNVKILKKKANFFLIKKNLPTILSGKLLKSGKLSKYLRIEKQVTNKLKFYHLEKNLFFFVKKKLNLSVQAIALHVWEKLPKKKQGKIGTTLKKQLKKKAMLYRTLLAIPSWPHRQFVSARNMFVKQVRNRKDSKKLLKFLLADKKNKKKVLSAQEKKKWDATIGVLTPEISVNFSERLNLSLFDLIDFPQSKLQKRVAEDLNIAVDYNITSRNKKKRWY